MKTKMTFIGSGSAFVDRKKNYQSNVLLSKNDKNLLIDCGSDARHALKDLGYSPMDIDAVFITHLHADHIGSLEWLAFCTHFNPNKEKPQMFLRDEEFALQLWGSLKGGLRSLQFKEPTLETFFDVIYTGEKFVWENIPFDAIQTIHTMDNNSYNPSYGLKFILNDKTVFFSGDTQFAPNQYIEILHSVDLVFHDCETSPFESGVHSYYRKMLEVPKDIKEKTWLYHYDDKPFVAEEENFAGCYVYSS